MSLIAHTSAHTVGGASYTTPSINTTGAKLLVVLWSYDNSVAPTATDSKGNTWVLKTPRSGSATRQTLRSAYVINPPSVGAGHTFSISDGSSDGFGAACVLAFDDAVTAFDVENGFGQTATGQTTIQPGSVTPASSGANVVIAGWGLDDPANTTWTVDSGFTLSDHEDVNPGSWYGCVGAYKLNQAGAVNPTFTRSNANTTGADTALIGVFSVGAAGSPPPPSDLMHQRGWMPLLMQ